MKSSAPSAPSPVAASRAAVWQRRLLGICLIVVAFELGLVLIVFPWRAHWEFDWLPAHSPRLAAVWMNHYFRGAVSGLGLLNIYIAMNEAFRLIASFFTKKTTQ
jgi:hypothetical protein